MLRLASLSSLSRAVTRAAAVPKGSLRSAWTRSSSSSSSSSSRAVRRAALFGPPSAPRTAADAAGGPLRGLRLLSSSASSPAGQSAPKVASEASRVAGLARMYATKFALAAAGLTAAYGVTRAVIFSSTLFFNITFQQVGIWAFYAGCATTCALGGVVWAVRRLLILRPEAVYRRAFKAVAKDKRVVALLGGKPVAGGLLRAYIPKGGRLESAVSPVTGKSRVVWAPSRVQMLFQVYGKQEQAVVSVEAERRNGRTQFNLIVVDLMTRSDLPPILVKGKEEHLYVADQLRGFLDFKKRYIQ